MDLMATDEVELEERVGAMVERALGRCLPQILHDLRDGEREEEARRETGGSKLPLGTDIAPVLPKGMMSSKACSHKRKGTAIN